MISTNKRQVRQDITNVYERNVASKKRIRLNRGGTRSSKTYSISQILVDWLLTGRIGEKHIPKGRGSFVRKGLPTLRGSVLQDIETILDRLGILNAVYHHKTEKYFKVGDRVLEYFSADDKQKIRSRGRNILFVCEANELTYNEFLQLLWRTSDVCFVDFNPDDPFHWLRTEIEDKRRREKGDVDLIVSTYKDNHLLPEEQIQEIEYIEKIDPVLWKVFGQGEYGITGDVIFPNVTIIPDMPAVLGRRGYGLDFGYTMDPSALYYCGRVQNRLYIDELLYSTGYLPKDLNEAFVDIGVDRRRPIIADSANPSAIDELAAYGWNIHGAKKGKGSVLYNIGLIKQHEIFITERSTGIIKERYRYKWKIDSDGKPMNVPVDAFNHGFDAVGYYASMMLKPLARVGRYRAISV